MAMLEQRPPPMSMSLSPFNAQSLAPAMMVASYVPTSFAIVFFATANDNDEYKDKSGLSGLASGGLCMLYALFHSAAVTTKSMDLCRILVLSRLFLGVMAIFGAFTIAAVGKSDATAFVVLYALFAIFSCPEAYLLYIYANAIHSELYTNAMGGPASQAAPLKAPGSYSTEMYRHQGAPAGMGMVTTRQSDFGVASTGACGSMAPNVRYV
eukprot:TRINITY_DN31920_c1_g1_i1.p1 TRINITY_DN31920_c1_g1~~TRINITY_DN31920_c1_g1_i1.p1  ORF type:complete len:210 (-),score=31.80 TRINITY_DN31920_c1_g1_i1:86-715(-)